MTSQPEQPDTRILARANENRCHHCPPERVCAWACAQGTSVPDHIIGAILEQQSNWALEPAPVEWQGEAQALWDAFNA